MERPFDYPGRHSDIALPDPYHMVRAEGCGEISITNGDLGEYVTHITPWFAPDWWDAEDIASVVANKFESERCHHSHDCCGRFYAGRGRVISISDSTDNHGDPAKLVLVEVRYTRNI